MSWRFDRTVRCVGGAIFVFTGALIASQLSPPHTGATPTSTASTPAPASFAAPPIFAVAGNVVNVGGFYSVAHGDFNGDGKLDFAAVGFSCAAGIDFVAVYLGNGDGTFQAPQYFPAGHCPYQVVVAKLRGPNASDDLVIVDASDVSVLLGNGDGTFQAAQSIASFDPSIASPLAVAVGDFNNDGKPDVAVALFTGAANVSLNGFYDVIAVSLGNGDGSFQAPLFSQSPGENNYEIHVADVNNDGKLDVITRTGLPATIYVSLGNGDGTFLPAFAVWSPPDTIFEGIAAGMNSFTLGDFNGDGNLDIAADAEGARVEVLLGTGTGAFTPIGSYIINDHQGGNGGGQILSEKLSKNGHVDLVVGTGYGATMVVLRGNGDGTFQSPTIYPLPQSDDEGLIVADMNGDGSPDVITGSAVWGAQKYLSIFLNDGDGNFSSAPPLFSIIAPYNQATQTNAVGITLADLTGNGKLDAIVTDWDIPIEPAANGQMPALPTIDASTLQVNSHGSISILAGNGDGTFQTEQQYYVGARPIAVSAADLDGDGKKDLVTVNAAENTLSILLGNGDHTFQSAITIPTGTNPTSLAVVDLNGDGKPDIAFTNLVDNTVSVLINQSTPGNIGFAAPVNYSVGTYPSEVVAQDFNHDGKIDLAIVDSGYFFASDDAGKHTQLSILLGNGDGTFQPAATQELWDRDGGDAIVAGDFGRGQIDLAVAHFGLGQLMILKGNGDGTFTQLAQYGVGAGAESMVAVDLNGDGKIDIAVSGLNDYSVALLLGNGDGTFVPAVQGTDDQPRPFGYATYDYPAFLAAGDLDGDGKPELLTTHLFDAAIAVLRNTTPTPVQLASVVSRKVHGSAGTYDVDLTNGAVECRSGDTPGDYTIVFEFANPLTTVGGVSVSAGTASLAGNNIDRSDAHNYVVNLTDVANAQTVTISLNNVTDSVGNFSSSVAGSMKVLVGDVNGSGVVDSGDVFLVRQQTGQSANFSNFRQDVNASGLIDSGDVFLTRQKTGTSAP